MPEDSDETRGDRVKAIREELKLKQELFADRLNEAAEGLGLPPIYHTSKVSKMETGNRGVSLDDAYAVAAIDPQRRGIDWITFGTRARKMKFYGFPSRSRNSTPHERRA